MLSELKEAFYLDLMVKKNNEVQGDFPYHSINPSCHLRETVLGTFF